MAKHALFRWPGVKSHVAGRVVPMIEKHLAVTGGRLISLFYGSGHAEKLVNIPRSRVIVADAQAEIRNLFAALARDPLRVWLALRRLVGLGLTSDNYRFISRAYRARSMHGRAARFLYLQSFAYNGLWRENRSGQHNVPPDPSKFARGLRVTLEDLKAAGLSVPSAMLPDWTLALECAQPGDLLYVDPPYGAFDKYTAEGFDGSDHCALALALERATHRAIGVIAFNEDEQRVRDLYTWAALERITRSGRMSSKKSTRRKVGELFITCNLKGQTP